jgi:CheY-like chemotaxis protein
VESKKRILVVDDDPNVRCVIAEILAGSGFDVVQADDGVGAMSALGLDGGFALLLTDIRMPRMGGLELASQATQRFPAMPVLFVSAFPGEEVNADVVRARWSFLRKPFRLQALVDEVRGLVEGP